ncbi:hypothetical protein [Glutamicibacter sp. MCAF14]|uniref:hypothetical protein n=1 Tax=Glutamicibacter sp. MCAF14 TaxID=3233043 RepID=UPI003F8EA2CA
MTKKTTLLFIHGVGNGDPENKWQQQLGQSLAEIDYPALENIDLVIPKFAHALKGADEPSEIPPRVHKRPNRSEAPQIRRDFERRMAAMEFKLGRYNQGKSRFGDDLLIHAAVEYLPHMAQASLYLKNEDIRGQVLRRILSKLPNSGRLVIVAHSLGSVIAADLLMRLPKDVEIAGLVTIGSPLGHKAFNIDKVWDYLKEPPAHLSWWVNFWNENDPVTAHRGLSSRFPWMTDYKIDALSLSKLQAHKAVDYLQRPIVAEAIGYGLYGAKSKEIVAKESPVESKLSDTEQMAMFALRFAHLINMRLENDLKERYSGALRQVQATVIDGIMRWNESEGRRTPYSLSRLAFDLSDLDAETPVPSPAIHLPIDQAILPLSALASENVIRPFEISVKPEIRQAALEDLSAEMGLSSKFGSDVFKAAKEAQVTLNGQGGLNWKKWGAVSLGAAALVAATGGLALAAAPGLAGAALLSSALASFGPGGMIGGLITAGSLASVGGGGIAFGLASAATSAADMEAVVERMLSTEILRSLQGLPADPAVRRTLIETEIQVRREYERLDEFSDRNATGLTEIKKKLTSIERALKYLIDNDSDSELDFNEDGIIIE